MLDAHMNVMHIYLMKIETYLSMNGMTQAEFARSVDVSQSTISRLRKGDPSASLSLLRKIAEVTNGAVNPNDFLPFRPEEIPIPSPSPAIPEAPAISGERQ
jgi:transcriptional regulator with XRE-family HTH domain